MKRVHFDNGLVKIVSWTLTDPGEGKTETQVQRDTCRGATVEAGTLTTDPKLVTCKRCLLGLVRRELNRHPGGLVGSIQEQVLKRVFRDSLFPKMLFKVETLK